MFWRKLWGGGAESALDRAEERLERGNPIAALELAGRHVDDRDARQRSRAQEVVREARRAAAAAALERSAAAEDAGDLLDAADWVDGALQFVADPERRRELERRKSELAGRRYNRGFVDWDPLDAEDVGLGSDRVGVQPRGLDDLAEVDPARLYELLIDGLREDLHPLYAERGPAFRDAYLELVRPDLRAALDRFDELAALAPDDPVLRFERGRARLAMDDGAGARRDFEAAWGTYGDGFLDRLGVQDEGSRDVLNLPQLWAEACLVSGDPEAVLERFRGRADAGELELHLVGPYLQALCADGRPGEAAELARRTVELRYAGELELYVEWARCLIDAGRGEQAVGVLERALKVPWPATPERPYPPEYPELVLTLLGLYLGMDWAASKEPDYADLEPVPGAGPEPLEAERIAELFQRIEAYTHEGAGGWRDPLAYRLLVYRLLARFRDLLGDEAGAAEARERWEVAWREAAAKWSKEEAEDADEAEFDES